MSNQSLLALPGRQEATVSVLVEPKGTDCFYETWRGTSVRAIKRAAMVKHPTAKLSFGSPIWQAWWGAH